MGKSLEDSLKRLDERQAVIQEKRKIIVQKIQAKKRDELKFRYQKLGELVEKYLPKIAIPVFQQYLAENSNAVKQAVKSITSSDPVKPPASEVPRAVSAAKDAGTKTSSPTDKAGK